MAFWMIKKVGQWTRLVAMIIAASMLSSVKALAQNQVRSSTKTSKAQSGSGNKSAIKSVGSLNASQLYLRARDYFSAGRYKEAIQYAAAAQRRSPGTRGPTILMAQSYYRLGNVPRATKLFLTISLAEVPQEAAVDYVLTMFAAGRYREAIKGYSLVPDNHPYKDITRFYAGVSLMHLRLYQKAQLFLRGARRIPANLNSQRRRLLSEIDDILDRERQGVFDQSRAYSYQSQQMYFPPPPVEAPPPARPTLPGGTPGTQLPVKPEMAVPAAKESLTYSLKPSLSYNQTSTKKDFHGYTQEQSEEAKPSGSFVLGLKYLGRPRSFGAQPGMDLSVTPSYADVSKRTSSSGLQADATDPNNVRNVTNRSEIAGYTQSYTLNVSGFYPVSDPVDISVGLEQRDDKARGSIGKAEASTITTTAKLVAEMSLFKLDLSLISAGITDKIKSVNNQNITTTKVNIARNGDSTTTSGGITHVSYSKAKLASGVKSLLALDASWLRNFDDFSVSVSANKSDNTRSADAVEFSNKLVLGQTSAKIEGSYNFSFGISAGASAALFQYDQIVIRNNGRVVEGSDEVKAGGSGNQIKATLKISPASFATVSTSYDYTERKLSVSDGSFQKIMMQDHWSQQTLTTLNLSFSYSF